jgi:hypothetical protein
MAKTIKMKANKARKEVNKKGNPSREEAVLILEKGETFGDALIGMLSLIATDYKGMGLAAIGLAKALAALKNVAKLTDVNIDSLFESELAHFENHEKSSFGI